MSQVLITGNPVDGLAFHGPYPDGQDWEALKLDNQEWWTAELHEPEQQHAACVKCGSVDAPFITGYGTGEDWTPALSKCRNCGYEVSLDESVKPFVYTLVIYTPAGPVTLKSEPVSNMHRLPVVSQSLRLGEYVIGCGVEGNA